MMYAFVNIKGDLGAAIEKLARDKQVSVGEVCVQLLETFIKDVPARPSEVKPTGLDAVTATYLKMRDTKSALKRACEEELDKIDVQMDKVETYLLKTLNDAGVNQMKTDTATFFKKKSIKPSCEDWDAFYQWVKENDTFEFLERRLTRTAVEGYMDEHETTPPGVKVHQEYKVEIRKGKG